jgi:hypothetical protein
MYVFSYNNFPFNYYYYILSSCRIFTSFNFPILQNVLQNHLQAKMHFKLQVLVQLLYFKHKEVLKAI